MESREKTNVKIAIKRNSRGRNNFEDSKKVVIRMVNRILNKMEFTLSLKIQRKSHGAFKKAPTTNAGAYSKYPRKYNNTRGIVIPIPIRSPRSKLELFRNNSSCLSFFFKGFDNLILKLG